MHLTTFNLNKFETVFSIVVIEGGLDLFMIGDTNLNGFAFVLEVVIFSGYRLGRKNTFFLSVFIESLE
jgi:hypothetical protein